MLQISASEEPIFICIDAIDQGEAGNGEKHLVSLYQILLKSPRTPMLVIRKQCVGVGVGECPGRAGRIMYTYHPRYMFSLTSGMVWGLGVKRPMGVGLVT